MGKYNKNLIIIEEEKYGFLINKNYVLFLIKKRENSESEKSKKKESEGEVLKRCLYGGSCSNILYSDFREIYVNFLNNRYNFSNDFYILIIDKDIDINMLLTYKNNEIKIISKDKMGEIVSKYQFAKKRIIKASRNKNLSGDLEKLKNGDKNFENIELLKNSIYDYVYIFSHPDFENREEEIEGNGGKKIKLIFHHQKNIPNEDGKYIEEKESSYNFSSFIFTFLHHETLYKFSNEKPKNVFRIDFGGDIEEKRGLRAEIFSLWKRTISGTFDENLKIFEFVDSIEYTKLISNLLFLFVSFSLDDEKIKKKINNEKINKEIEEKIKNILEITKFLKDGLNRKVGKVNYSVGDIEGKLEELQKIVSSPNSGKEIFITVEGKNIISSLLDNLSNLPCPLNNNIDDFRKNVDLSERKIELEKLKKELKLRIEMIESRKSNKTLLEELKIVYGKVEDLNILIGKLKTDLEIIKKINYFERIYKEEDIKEIKQLLISTIKKAASNIEENFFNKFQLLIQFFDFKGLIEILELNVSSGGSNGGSTGSGGNKIHIFTQEGYIKYLEESVIHYPVFYSSNFKDVEKFPLFIIINDKDDQGYILNIIKSEKENKSEDESENGTSYLLDFKKMSKRALELIIYEEVNKTFDYFSVIEHEDKEGMEVSFLMRLSKYYNYTVPIREKIYEYFIRKSDNYYLFLIDNKFEATKNILSNKGNIMIYEDEQGQTIGKDVSIKEIFEKIKSYKNVKKKINEKLKEFFKKPESKTKFILIDLILNKSWGKTGADLFFDIYNEVKRENEEELIPIRFVPVIFISKHFSEYTTMLTMGKAKGDWFIFIGESKSMSSRGGKYEKLNDVFYVFSVLENIKYFVYVFYVLLMIKVYYLSKKNKFERQFVDLNIYLDYLYNEIFGKYLVPEHIEYIYSNVLEPIYTQLKVFDSFNIYKSEISWDIFTNVCFRIFKILEIYVEPYWEYIDIKIEKIGEDKYELKIPYFKGKISKIPYIELDYEYDGKFLKTEFNKKEKKGPKPEEENKLDNFIGELTKRVGAENVKKFYVLFENVLNSVIEHNVK